MIGSGIVGASAAYHLAKKQVEVVLVDKQHEGNATAAGAGIVCPWISRVEDENHYELAKRGAIYYPDLIAQLEADGEVNVGYKKVGALSVSSDKKLLDDVEERVRQKRKSSPEAGDIERLTGEEAQALFPPLNPELEAVYITGAARVDGRLMRASLKRAAEKHGAKCINGEATLTQQKDRVTGIEVNGEVIKADKLVVAAGAWVNSLLTPIGVQVNIEPQRGQIAHMTLSHTDTSSWPVVLPHTSHYMLAFDDSRVVAGATRETGAGFDYRLTPGGISEVLDHALDVAPGLEDSTLKEVRIGFRPMGPDRLPLVGSITNQENIIMANGLGASGLTMGPYVGKIAASLANDESVSFDLSPYDPMRAITIQEKV